MGANLSSGLLSLHSPAVVWEGNTMFFFVIPGEFFSVPLANPPPAITYYMPMSSQVCVCVCVRKGERERDGWSAGVYIGVFIPFQTRNCLCTPPPSPPSPTVNQMAWQFGSGIKALVFMSVIMVMMMVVFISTIWWNPWLKLTGVEQVQYRARWRIPLMSPYRVKYRPPTRRMGCFSARSSHRARSNIWLLNGSGAPQRPLCRGRMIYGR